MTGSETGRPEERVSEYNRIRISCPRCGMFLEGFVRHGISSDGSLAQPITVSGMTFTGQDEQGPFMLVLDPPHLC